MTSSQQNPHASAEALIAELTRKVAAYENSTFWRLTFPARFAVTKLKNLKQRLKGNSATAVAEAPEAEKGELSADPAGLHFTRSENPVVSIIIPTYGQVPVTLRCLRSIMASPPSCPYEIIIAEDASGDPAVRVFDSIPGLLFLNREQNLGFLHNVNDAAEKASGRYLYFLNNDTELLPGAADALVKRLEADPGIGMTGSKLLFADGTLQEAGGIIWNDASGQNFGRYDTQPYRSLYNWPREVDYISGASVAVPRDLFFSLGKFDEIFAPAYYEETDFAFRVRAAGRRVVFEPDSVVIHHEGLSHGTDESTGIKSYQVRNKTIMYDRWKDVLKADHYPLAAHYLRAIAQARHKTTILIIDHYVPQPDRDAGSRATMCVIRALLEAGWLVKFWPADRRRTDWSPALEQTGVEILDDTCPHSFSEWLSLFGEDLDHILIMRPMITRDMIGLAIEKTKAKLSYYGHDIHFLRMQRALGVSDSPVLRQETEEMERLETWLWRQFDSVIYLSDYETALVRRMAPEAPAHTIVPFAFTPRPERSSIPENRTILFVGGFAHPPNADAAVWLKNEIFPAVLEEVPDAHLVLAGSEPAPSVRALADAQTTVTGTISENELSRLYETARVAVVPLRFGAGIKNKVLEALNYGLPLVTTTIGAEGIAGLDRACDIADQPERISEALITLLRDDTLWKTRSEKGMFLIRESFSPEAFSASLLNALPA